MVAQFFIFIDDILIVSLIKYNDLAITHDRLVHIVLFI